MDTRIARRLCAVAFAPLILVGCSTAAADPNPEGTWGADAPGEPYLEFWGDGTVSGSDGCNSMGGSWELVDDRVELSGLTSTLMACEDVDTWLGAARSIVIDEDTAHIYGEDGEELGALERQQGPQ